MGIKYFYKGCNATLGFMMLHNLMS